ncbi:hypothetical protein FHETE_484 [Fusarium heterosporum]|uniref:Halomucin n=1 Tax=Fusarium heterosporum TaxID=42747 RepID=A0A8H5X441_FUSHE|nr:hypothetical protein FHETE_484 [Fusarium heterosporum]
MSEGSVTGFDIDIVDLTSDEDHPALDNHGSATPAPQEIVLGLNGYGEAIRHMVNGPEAVDLMDIDEVDDLQSPQLSDEQSLFVEDVDNVSPGPPSPPSSDGSDSANDPDSSEEDSEDSDDDADDRVIQQDQSPINGGTPDGDDPDEDGSDNDGSDNDGSDNDGSDNSSSGNGDSENEPGPNNNRDDDSINDPDTVGDLQHGWKNAWAELDQCLEEEQIEVPDFHGNCIKTCLPLWLELAGHFRKYRNRFLRKRQELKDVKSRNRNRVAALNRRIRELERLLPKPRKTERTWPEICRQWLAFGECVGYLNWGDIYKLSCKEENMSWAFSETKRPNLHPYLKLRPPTDEEEAMAIGGEDESCSPQPRRGSFEIEQDNQPCHFNRLPEKLQVEILRLALVFDGELVHAISRLDPYYEPDSVHINCNNRMSLVNRFHIGHEPVSLTFSSIRPQRLLAPLMELTYKIDKKNKYTSRRTHDLAFLTEARRLKTIAIHLPESSVSYMRRKHEPPQIIQHMVEKTENQPNFRKNRALRTLQGVDYLYCLRGVSQITFWDYNKYLEAKHQVPVRDWTFVCDINESVRREKDQEQSRLSQLRNLAPMLGGLRPSSALAELLEAIVNPPVPPTGLLSPPPEDETLYPHPQSPVDLTSDDDGDSDVDGGSNTEDQSESEGSDGDDSDDGDDGGSDGEDDEGSDDGDDGDDGDSDDEDDDGFDGDSFGGHGGDDSAADFNHDNGQEEDDVVRYLGSRLEYEFEEHKYEPGQSNEVWSDNGTHYEIISDDEDEEDMPSPAADEHAEDMSEVANDDGEDISEAVDADADQAAMPPPPAPARHRVSEGPQGEQREQRDKSASLFVTSPERERQTPFTVKVETPPPSPPPPCTSPASGAPTDNNAVHDNATPPRETREESDLFASPTPYNQIVSQGGDRTSPIDLTRDLDLETPIPPSRSHSRSSPAGSQGQGQNKRSYGAFVSDSGDEDDADDANDANDANDGKDEDDCVVLESPPKRARRSDSTDDEDGQARQPQPS